MSRVRSVLYLPASNARAIDKARSLACDVAVLDVDATEKAAFDAVDAEALERLMARIFAATASAA